MARPKGERKPDREFVPLIVASIPTERSATYFCPVMRRALFFLALALYSWGTLEMHEWVRVPGVVLHLLEHHSDLGHHDEDGPGHRHADLPPGEHDHSPFDDGCNEQFCGCSSQALLPLRDAITFAIPSPAVRLLTSDVEARVASFSGSKWNPPRA